MQILQWAMALLPYFNLAALVALIFDAGWMRRLQEIVGAVEERNRQWETIEVLKKILPGLRATHPKCHVAVPPTW